MPQTWDEKGNPVQAKAPPVALPGSAAANPNAPAIMPPTAKPKQTWDEKGNVIQAKPVQVAQPTQTPLKPVEKAMPFQSGVASGMMLDPTKIAQQKTTGGQALEAGKEMASGALDLGKSILKDPLNVGNPIDAIVKGQQDAYKKVHEGLKSGNHDLLMNGLGEAVGNLSMLLGGAKSAKEGLGVASTARDASFAAKDLTSKRAIVSAASHGALDTLKDEHSSAIDTAVKAERQRIGGNVASINTTDLAKDPKGYVPQKLALATLDQAVSDKKANVLLDKRMLPKVAQVRGLLEGHAQNLTFNDLKQVRSVVGDALGKATGVERAVLGDYYSSLTNNLKGRAAHLGKLSEWNDYNDAAEKLAGHENNLIPELKDSKTGLDYAKKIVSEQNQGRLSTLTKDLHMPDDFFSSAAKSHKAIINFAKMTEGDSLVAKTANRLVALKQHPIAATLGGVAGVTAGRAIGTAMGSPMAGSFIGLTLGAAFAHDLMSKYDAAKAIREIGGPSGVMGVRAAPQQPPPSSAPPNAAMTSPQSGPGGGGSTPPSRPPGGMLPGSPTIPIDTSKISPALAKLLPESIKQTERRGAPRPTGLNSPPPDNIRIARMDSLRKIVRDSTAPERDRKIAQNQLEDMESNPSERNTLGDNPSQLKKDKPLMSREEAEAASAKRTEGRTQRFEGTPTPEAKSKAEMLGLEKGQDVPGRWFHPEKGIATSYAGKGKVIAVDVPDDVFEKSRYHGSQDRVLSDKWLSQAKPLSELPDKPPEGHQRLFRGDRYSEEARGRTESVRKGMTKDTPETRRAKAAERIAAKRSEASRTNIKGTLEDQARQVAGKMDFQGKSNIELEEGLKELFGENGNRFMKEFKSLARQKKWSEDVYRGYLEETLKKRAEELASKPPISGLNSKVKN